MLLRCLIGLQAGRELDYSYQAAKVALAAGTAEPVNKPPEKKRKRRGRPPKNKKSS